MSIRNFTPLAVAAIATVSPAAATAKSPPIGKVYGCYEYTGGPTGISLVDAVKLKSKTTYLVAPSYKGHHLAGKAGKGSYTLNGNKLAFKTGAWKHMFGVYTPKYKDKTGTVHAAQIHLDNSKHEWTGISCYLIG